MLQAHTIQSNCSIFVPPHSGSPGDGLMTHISALGRVARLDFERCRVAGEVIYAIDGDTAPFSQQDEEARIGTLAYALRKLGDPADAAEFMRCLNAICAEGDARARQTVASYYYGEISEQGAGPALKEMALLAMQLVVLTSTAEVSESDSQPDADWNDPCGSGTAPHDKDQPEDIRAWVREEVAALTRMIHGRRRSARPAHDEFAAWLSELETSGVTLQELDDAFAQVEALEQYDEGGALIVMSGHERAITCGRVDPEYVADDLPERARHLAAALRRDYASGISLEEIRDDFNRQSDIIRPRFSTPGCVSRADSICIRCMNACRPRNAPF